MMTINSISFILCLTVSYVASRPALAFAFVKIPNCYTETKRNLVNRNIHLISVAAVKEDDFLFDAEDAAAFDAHDLSDPGMEAAAMERAVIIAEEFKSSQSKMVRHNMHKHATSESKKTISYDLRSDDDDDSLLDAEDAAAFDAHDLSDPGMEAAAMERAVMIAEEFKSSQSKMVGHNMHKHATGESKKTISYDLRSDDDDDSSLDAEDAAAFDAHDLSDPGMEAAAMERAVMIANEFKKKQ